MLQIRIQKLVDTWASTAVSRWHLLECSISICTRLRHEVTVGALVVLAHDARLARHVERFEASLEQISSITRSTSFRYCSHLSTFKCDLPPSLSPPNPPARHLNRSSRNRYRRFGCYGSTKEQITLASRTRQDASLRQLTHPTCRALKHTLIRAQANKISRSK